jgi:Tol biopolymer transport system component
VLAYLLLAGLGASLLTAALYLSFTGRTSYKTAVRACAPKPVTWREQSAPESVTGLLAIRLSDQSVTTLMPGRTGRLANPAFSPDGRRLALLLDPNGMTAHLAVCDLERRSTSALKLPVPAGDFPLSWSRDSRSLVFLGGDVLGYGADQKPYVVHVPSRRLRNIGSNASWYWDGVALSPDDRKLALLLALRNPGGQEPERLVVFDLAAKTWERIAGSRQMAQIDAMSWSPSGRKIVFSAYKHDEHGDLYVADIATKRVTPLLRSPAGERRPAWSPDGRWIAYERSAPGHPRETSIWLLDVETGRTHRLTSGRSDVSPAWSPDGRQIAFVRGRLARG